MTREGPGERFVWHMKVPEQDIDENCHVSNVAYVRWTQEAARAHAEAIGWSKERFQSTGCFFLIRRHEVDYLRPAHDTDDIKIETWVEEWRPASATRMTRIMRAAPGQPDVELVVAKTEWVFVSIEGTRPKRIPTEVRLSFSRAAPLPDDTSASP
jgi:acyl-CoA thioester hydrolase